MYIEKVTKAGLGEITEPLKSDRKPQITGWILLNPDISHLKHIISRAAEFNINHLQISHGIVHSAYTIVDEPWRIGRVNFITARAKKENIESYLWTHELDTAGSTSTIHSFGNFSRIDTRKYSKPLTLMVWF